MKSGELSSSLHIRLPDVIQNPYYGVENDDFEQSNLSNPRTDKITVIENVYYE